MNRLYQTSSGPFHADQIRSGDPYELSNGHAIRCMTTGARSSRANLVGGSVLDSDPPPTRSTNLPPRRQGLTL